MSLVISPKERYAQKTSTHIRTFLKHLTELRDNYRTIIQNNMVLILRLLRYLSPSEFVTLSYQTLNFKKISKTKSDKRS